MKVPPMYITFAIAHYVAADPRAELGADHYDSRAGKETVKWLLDNGLIDRRDYPCATPKLTAWIEHLCSQPLPVETWTIPTPPEWNVPKENA